MSTRPVAHARTTQATYTGRAAEAEKVQMKMTSTRRIRRLSSPGPSPNHNIFGRVSLQRDPAGHEQDEVVRVRRLGGSTKKNQKIKMNEIDF